MPGRQTSGPREIRWHQQARRDAGRGRKAENQEGARKGAEKKDDWHQAGVRTGTGKKQDEREKTGAAREQKVGGEKDGKKARETESDWQSNRTEGEASWRPSRCMTGDTVIKIEADEDA